MVDSEQAACGAARDPEVCDAISKMLARIGDKWSLLIVATLGEGALRFNQLRRTIGDISQKMLSANLKALERDGLLERTVTPSVPPRVEYALTDDGREMLVRFKPFWLWIAQRLGHFERARADYDAGHAPRDP